jgi:ATP-dependent DNA ligase
MTNEGSRLRGAELSKSELKEAPINPVFRHARKMGLEGIVSKRLGSTYRSGRTSDWRKFKNPEACEAGGGGGVGQMTAGCVSVESPRHIITK